MAHFFYTKERPLDYLYDSTNVLTPRDRIRAGARAKKSLNLKDSELSYYEKMFKSKLPVKPQSLKLTNGNHEPSYASNSKKSPSSALNARTILPDVAGIDRYKYFTSSAVSPNGDAMRSGFWPLKSIVSPDQEAMNSTSPASSGYHSFPSGRDSRPSSSEKVEKSQKFAGEKLPALSRTTSRAQSASINKSTSVVAISAREWALIESLRSKRRNLSSSVQRPRRSITMQPTITSANSKLQPQTTETEAKTKQQQKDERVMINVTTERKSQLEPTITSTTNIDTVKTPGPPPMRAPPPQNRRDIEFSDKLMKRRLEIANNAQKRLEELKNRHEKALKHLEDQRQRITESLSARNFSDIPDPVSHNCATCQRRRERSLDRGVNDDKVNSKRSPSLPRNAARFPASPERHKQCSGHHTPPSQLRSTSTPKNNRTISVKTYNIEAAKPVIRSSLKSSPTGPLRGRDRLRRAITTGNEKEKQEIVKVDRMCSPIIPEDFHVNREQQTLTPDKSSEDTENNPTTANSPEQKQVHFSPDIPNEQDIVEVTATEVIELRDFTDDNSNVSEDELKFSGRDSVDPLHVELVVSSPVERLEESYDPADSGFNEAHDKDARPVTKEENIPDEIINSQIVDALLPKACTMYNAVKEPENGTDETLCLVTRDTIGNLQENGSINDEPTLPEDPVRNLQEDTIHVIEELRPPEDPVRSIQKATIRVVEELRLPEDPVRSLQEDTIRFIEELRLPEDPVRSLQEDTIRVVDELRLPEDPVRNSQEDTICVAEELKLPEHPVRNLQEDSIRAVEEPKLPEHPVRNLQEDTICVVEELRLSEDAVRNLQGDTICILDELKLPQDPVHNLQEDTIRVVEELNLPEDPVRSLQEDTISVVEELIQQEPRLPETTEVDVKIQVDLDDQPATNDDDDEQNEDDSESQKEINPDEAEAEVDENEIDPIKPMSSTEIATIANEAINAKPFLSENENQNVPEPKSDEDTKIYVESMYDEYAKMRDFMKKMETNFEHNESLNRSTEDSLDLIAFELVENAFTEGPETFAAEQALKFLGVNINETDSTGLSPHEQFVDDMIVNADVECYLEKSLSQDITDLILSKEMNGLCKNWLNVQDAADQLVQSIFDELEGEVKVILKFK